MTTIYDHDGIAIHRGATPLTVPLDSGRGFFLPASYRVECAMPGKPTQSGVISASWNPWHLGNLVFGGAIGLLIVDPATGAMYRLPRNYSVCLPQ